MGAIEIAAADLFHAAGAAAEEDADFVVRPVRLVDADFLAFALGQVDEFGGDGGAGGLFEERADASAQGAAGDVGAAVGVFDDGVIGAADFEGAFASSDVETGFAMQLAFEDQLADQFEFRLWGVSAHLYLLVVGDILFVVCNDGFEQVAESFVASGFVFAGYLE